MLPALARKAIETYSDPGALVADPMCGIGTTLVEAVHLGRRAVGVELEGCWARHAALNVRQAGLHVVAARQPLPGAQRLHAARLQRGDVNALRGEVAGSAARYSPGMASGSALLIMDVQRGIVERFAPQAETLLGTLARAAAAARGAGIPVIFVRVAFRAGAPEVSVRNRAFSAIGTATGMGEQDAATEIHLALDLKPADIIVTKKRVSAFAGSDLDVLLRSLQATSLTLAGIATSGVVLSTLRQAADLDYELTVLTDGCLDGDPEVHRVLLEKVFPRQASVIDTEAWIATLAKR